MKSKNQSPGTAFTAAFLQGLGAVLVLYAAAFGYVMSQQDQIYNELSERLASLTVPLTLIEIAPNEPRPEEQKSPEAQTSFPTPEKAEPQDLNLEDITEPVDVVKPEQTSESEPQVMAADAPPAEAGQNSVESVPGLIEAPVEGLYRETEFGTLPQISEDGRRPFDVYARPYTPSGRAMIALVAQDYGLSENLSARIRDTLPPEITLLTSPYSEDPQKAVDMAREAGHEIWLKIPGERSAFPVVDPGPDALMSNANLNESREVLRKNLTRFAGYAGAALFIDEALLRASPVLSTLLENMMDTGIGYLDLNPSSGALAEDITKASNAPYFAVDIDIGNQPLSAELLSQIESQARRNGFIVVLFEPLPGNIANIESWSKDLSLRGLELAPLSAIDKVQN